MNSKMRNFKRALSLRILTKFMIAIVAFIVLVIGMLLMGLWIFSLFTWQGDEPIYQFLRVFNDNRYQTLMVIFVVGFSVIFIRYWIKTLSYLEDVIQATGNVYDTKDEMIVLPVELKQVENQMNQIKLNVRQSERAAKEAEQRKNDLIVYLAHDLKTPLTSVIGYLSLLRDEDQISEALREKYLSISLEKAERLEDLINEFFEITRFNLTNLCLELSNVNLARMLEQIVFEIKPMLSEKKLSCRLAVPPDIMIKCDVNKMQRVFDNLLRNAVNYSFEGSVIDITVTQEGDLIKMKFLNHGNTIPQEKLSRIFEQFYRLDTARNSKTGGVGLGLAITKEIIELHHGTIVASSADEIIVLELTIPFKVI